MSTIAAIATAPGRAGVAVVRVSGPEALTVAERLAGPGLGRVSHRRLRAPDGGATLDDALVLTFRAPHSYTGEDVAEFQCHGGAVTPRRVLSACLAAGARLARRGEFTQRAFLNGRLDLDEAEAVLALIDAKTERAADAALAGLTGADARELGELYDLALAESSVLEHALDVDEAELPDGFFALARERLTALAARLEAACRRRREGMILREGALVVLFGPPNVGKSSLLNALLGADRAIVSAIPGTTRDTIEETLDLDGWPVRLVDTAGVRETADEVEFEGVRRSEQLVREADVVLELADGEFSGPVRPHRLRVRTKADLAAPGPRSSGATWVSVKTGEGLSELRSRLRAELEAEAGEFDEAPPGASAALAALIEARRLVGEALRSEDEVVLMANAVRTLAERLGRELGATYSEDLLERVFSRFCVGK